MLKLIGVLLGVGLACGAVQAQQAKVSPAEREAKARAYFTDTVLKSQSGRDVRFYSDALKNKVVLLSFIYTECRDACPLIIAQLKQVKNELGEDFGRDVRFITISVDPQRDRPEDMAKFARKFDAVHPEWLFLTGEPASIEHVVKKLGSWTPEPQTHSTATIIGSTRQGRWKKVRPDAPTRIVVDELQRLVAGEIEARRLAQAAPPAR